MDVDVQGPSAAAARGFGSFSLEMLETMLKQLEVKDLEVARAVCKLWHQTIRSMEARDKLKRYACGNRGYLSFKWLEAYTRAANVTDLSWMNTDDSDEVWALPNDRLDIPTDRLFELNRMADFVNDSEHSLFAAPCTCGRVPLARIASGVIASTDYFDVHAADHVDRWEVLDSHRNRAFTLCTLAESIDPRLITEAASYNKEPIPWTPLFIQLRASPRPRTIEEFARRLIFELQDGDDSTDPGVRALLPCPARFSDELQGLVTAAVASRSDGRPLWVQRLHTNANLDVTAIGMVPYNEIARHFRDVVQATIAKTESFVQHFTERYQHVVFVTIERSNGRRTEVAAGMAPSGHIVGLFAELRNTQPGE
eukprot:Unigene12360_Nuclearia_a/m.37564 Unigene12360_Nuclearia_a/g.37564  ORF Unigene12360_Nuclearia_a/g.37564 Unigene12360_Nuclearia_a/m.37564 type:complete len:367 (+) Unigene12360_Nuclearia_a:48-1148(+)